MAVFGREHSQELARSTNSLPSTCRMLSYAKLEIDHCPECIATKRAVIDHADVKMLHLRIDFTLIPSRLDTQHPILSCVIEWLNKWDSIDSKAKKQRTDIILTK